MPQENTEEYYILPDGRLVFTEVYHLKRGYCCGSSCRHCPFDYKGVSEPRRSRLLAERKQKEDEQRRNEAS